MNAGYYQQKIAENNIELSKVKARLRVFPVLKLLFFVAAVMLVVAIFQWGWDRTVCIALGTLSLVIFSLLYRLDEHFLQRKIYFTNLQKVYSDELLFLQGDYTPFENGARFVHKNHPFSYDLDVFGESSIYQMINRTTTEEGGKCLAEKLSTISDNESEIAERQSSLTELMRKDVFRHQYMAIGKEFDRKKNNSGLIINQKDNNTFLTSTTALVLICISILITLTVVVFAWLGALPWSVAITFFMMQLLIPMSFQKVLHRVGADIGFMHQNTRIYAELLEVVNRESFDSAANKRLKDRLFGVHDSRKALRELSQLLKKFDQRNNAYILVLFNGFFMRDLFLLRQFYRWKNTYLPHLDSWIGLLSEMESRVSQANYMFNFPEFIQPSMEVGDEILLDASALGHPFIAKEKRVDNDILIGKGQFLIVTGANMAGKSTFLRTLGTNYILAVNGMNVCASKFNFNLFTLFSSMRNTDNLASGTSYFKAELERMRELIRYCRAHRHTLIILDELLKGTNSKDKLDGSRLFLQKMAELPVTGIIATHDLELAKLEEEMPDRFHNYCFEISLSEEEQYSYKIQRGVSRNLNATYLLKKILMEEL